MNHKVIFFKMIALFHKNIVKGTNNIRSDLNPRGIQERPDVRQRKVVEKLKKSRPITSRGKRLQESLKYIGTRLSNLLGYMRIIVYS